MAVMFTLVIGILLGGLLKANQNQEIQLEARSGIATRAFKIILDDKELGIVRDKDAVKATIEKIQKELSDEYDAKIVIKEVIKFKTIQAENSELALMSEIEDSIRNNMTFSLLAYAIEINGDVLGTLKSKFLAEQIIEYVKKPYTNRMLENGSKIEDVKILEDVKIVEKEMPINDIEEFDKVLKIIQKGTDEEKTHVVEKGESFWSIAQKYNITVDELEQANPDKKPKRLQPNDELSLIVPKPYLTVVTHEEANYVENVKYDTKYEYSSKLYKDETRTQRNGTYGKKEVVAKVEKHNGVEVAKEIISETLVSDPKSKIVLKGTKEIPPTIGKGTFIRPTKGRLTSAFGSRWGKFHYGVDLASRTGTPIKAADGGIVTFAGWKGTYGLMVEIDHGGGFKTRYAHCSKIYVKQGQKVYQDKTVAAVGNTGRSTGPHVHFEVLKYGKPQNPYDYIGTKYR